MPNAIWYFGEIINRITTEKGWWDEHVGIL